MIFDGCDKKIKQGLKEAAEGKTVTYSSVEEMWKDMDARIAKEKKEHPFKYYGSRFYLRYIERPCEDVWYFIRYEIPHWIKYGYSRKDIWCLATTTAEFLLPRLKELKECKSGIPCGVIPDDAKLDESGNPTQEEWDKAQVYWYQCLDKMIRAFELAIKSNEGEEGCDVYVDEPAKKEFEEGMQLFAKYFMALWT